MNIFLGIIVAIISSISMYFFLYKLSIELTFQVMEEIIFIAFLMYLYLSIINYYFSKKDIIDECRLENKIILYSSWAVILLLCFILYLFKIIKKENVKIDFYVVFCLNIISITHIEIIFRIFNIELRHYSVIHICLFIDVFLLSLFFYLLIFGQYKKMKMK